MRRGFTLIELLVVIAIVGLLTTMSAAVILSVRQKRQTKAVATQVQNFILEARSYAVSPKATTSSGNINIIISAHSIAAKVGATDIITPVNVASNVTLTCTQNPCISFITNDANTMGQAKTLVGKITAKNTTGESYTILTDHLSGNVTVSTP